MSLIRVDLDYPIEDGLQVTFKAPCNSNQATGLKIYYPVITENGQSTSNQTFTFGDSATYNITGTEHLFVTGAYVSVILDTTNNRAYLQNGDTNHYLEARMADLESDMEVLSNPADLWVWEKSSINEFVADGASVTNIPFVGNTAYTLYRTASVINGNIELSDSVTYTAGPNWGDMSAYYYIYQGTKYHLGTKQSAMGNYLYYNGNELQIERTVDLVGYVTSPTSTTYPEDGRQGDHWYTRLGQIGGAFDGVKIETGSYVGTGTVGIGNENSLTFSFEPELIIIEPNGSTGNQPYRGILLKGAQYYYTSPQNTTYKIRITWNGTTVSWYHDSNGGAPYQLNYTGSTYGYIAIG